jgi:transcriptional regulator with XRE-family HTH domain
MPEATLEPRYLAAFLRSIVEQRGIEISALANDVGIERTKLSRIINGRMTASVEEATKLSTTLVVPVTTLFSVFDGDGTLLESADKMRVPTEEEDIDYDR